MKYLFAFLFMHLLITTGFTQNYVVQKEMEIALSADAFIGVDKFSNLYYIKNNTLYRKNQQKKVEYRELQLGEIFSVDLLNPLRITVFYKQANTAVILDNRLNELKRISFDNLTDYKLVDFCTTANDQSLWVFNADLQQLEIFNYNTNTTEIRSLPIANEVLNQKSNFNFCWLQTENGLQQFNIYASLIKKEEVNYRHIEVDKNHVLLIKGDLTALYFNHKSETKSTLKLPKIEYKQVHINNQKLYLYDGNTIYIYQIIAN